MSTPERRYSEEEIQEIFERATELQEKQGRSERSKEGLTLPEIQEIGREVGVSPERIESAARSLDLPAPSPPEKKRFFGLPVGVGRTVSLPRRLTEEEWHRLVVDLRDTFDARGKIREEGRFREWRNGNLQALLEPVGSGERLRLRTEKGGAKPGIGVGAGLLGGGALFSLLYLLTGGEVGRDPESMFTIMVVGGVFLALNLFRLPGWAATRERQMKEVAERVLGTIEKDEEPTDLSR
ncbi:MAG: hypothetical protein R3223_13405 [Longimicrobiales bacterium]|nr:hypothetical protein [Longimicrobiales bacterium]